jgi:hypothetical protein
VDVRLPPLNGITSSPLLKDDGTILSSDGYDPATGMWRENVPDLSRVVPATPTREDAEAALRNIRGTFRTFCFADAETIVNQAGIAVVDVDRPPGKDESTFLAGLQTAAPTTGRHYRWLARGA